MNKIPFLKEVPMNIIFKLTLVSVVFTSFVANADLLITPTRVVFNEGERVEEVILVNSADEERSYALSWTQMAQKESSDYRLLRDDELASFATASEFIRFTPSRLTLKPGENQRIKLMLRPTAELKGKELRSHLKFTVIPNQVLQQSSEQQEDVDGISMKLNLFLNYSIPVVVKGHTAVPDVQISNIQVKQAKSASNVADITFSLNKSAPYSFYGDMTAYFKADGSEDFVPVGYLNNFSMFHESSNVNVTIHWTQNVALESGDLKIIYKGKSDNTDNQIEAGINLTL
jgi:P pilus assembly chaperone PapD